MCNHVLTSDYLLFASVSLSSFTMLQVSAKSGRGVEDVFLQLSKSMSDKAQAAQSSSKPQSMAGSKPANRAKSTIQVVDDEQEPVPGGTCC